MMISRKRLLAVPLLLLALCAAPMARAATVVEASNQGGTLKLNVTVGASLSWTAAESSDWFEITAGASGTGPGEITVSYQGNPASQPRSGILTITVDREPEDEISEIEIRQAATGPWSLVVGGGIVLTAPTMDGKFENNAVVEIAATIPPGKKFVEWIGGTSTVADVRDATTTVTMLADVNIAAKFEYAVPEVSAVTPASGPDTGGTRISIQGKNFTEASEVLIDGTPGLVMQVGGDNVVLVTTPAHAAGTVQVTVETPGGVSNAGTFTYTSTAPAAPVLTQLSPGSGPASGGTLVTIIGSNLAGATSVSFGGAAATGISVTGANLLTCTTPQHGSGNVQVTVTTAGGASNTLTFTYQDDGSGGCSGGKSAMKIEEVLSKLFVGLMVALALLASDLWLRRTA
jgi:hypothetical protein